MKEYLKFVIEFEKYVYIWSNAMDKANERMRLIHKRRQELDRIKANSTNQLNNIDDRFARQNRIKDNEAKRIKKSANSARTVLIIFILISILVGCAIFFIGVQKKVRSIPFIAVLSIFSMFTFFVTTVVGPVSFVVYISKKNKYNNYSKEINSYANSNSKKNRTLIYESQRDDAVKESIANDAEELIVKQNQDEIFKALNEAKKNLSQIYGEDILPTKYRSLNAATTLFEYLDTGRCDKIKGHGGIFDTYDVDLQRGIIIETLYDIRNSMYRIEENQNLLYKEMQQANRTLLSINSNLEDVRETNREIARNTAISAEANRQTAACVRWATWNAWAKGY